MSRTSIAFVFLASFIGAGSIAVVNEFVLHAWPHVHTLSHYLFGFGLPLVFASIFVSPPGKDLPAWKQPFSKWLERNGNLGFAIGAAITEGWSIWNELAVYLINNPNHGLDWHHWWADLAGICTSFLFYRLFVGNSRFDNPCWS